MKKTLLLTLMIGILLSVNIYADNHKTSKKLDIIETAVSTEGFATLVTAIKTAGLVDALKGNGPFTVFAPTDEAFSKLPKGTIESLLKDKDKLTSILTYHVVSGNVLASDVIKIKSAKTLNGQEVSITINDGNVMIDNAKVLITDIVCSNGVIHVIDNVIVPAEKKSEGKTYGSKSKSSCSH